MEQVFDEQVTSEQALPTRVWDKSKWLVKGGFILLITLLLLIPTEYVNSLIREREATQQEATREVASKWGGRQKVSGPVLVLPYMAKAPGKPDSAASRQQLIVLPDTVRMETQLTPTEKHRGVYQVMLYNAGLRMSGTFGTIPLAQYGIEPEQVLWEQAMIQVGVSDPQAVTETAMFRMDGQVLNLESTDEMRVLPGSGFSAPVRISNGHPFNFEGSLNLKGSEDLLFVPVGKETEVELNSTWKDPSFTGSQLPRQVQTDSGFRAYWKSLAYNRGYPQSWTTNTGAATYNFDKAAFGVDLFIPVNGYQKVHRSVKYAMLCIMLTFAAFFLIEISSKRSIHPFQYALVGLALVLFYTLLLSISEYTGFNTAYLLASFATIGLIAWFVRGLLSSGKLTSILTIVLVLLYAYLFSILQVEAYSLLIGSIGLFLSLGVIMRFSRKLSW